MLQKLIGARQIASRNLFLSEVFARTLVAGVQAWPQRPAVDPDVLYLSMDPLVEGFGTIASDVDAVSTLLWG